MMRAIFLPAAHLVGRLRYAQKFAVVGLVLLLPLGFVARAYVQLQNDRIAFSARERVGVTLMVPLVELTARSAEARHRMVLRQAPDDRALDAAVARVDAADARHGAMLETAAHWQEVRGQVGHARDSRDPEQAFARFNAATEGLRDLIVHVGDASNLTLDPDLDTYYLMDTLQFRLPVAMDVAGRMIDRTVLARRDIGRERTEVLIDLGLDNGALVSTRDDVASGLETAARSTRSATLPVLAGDGFAAVDVEAQRVIATITSTTRSGRVEDVDPDAADAFRAEAEAFAHAVAGELDGLLVTRIDGFAAGARSIEIVALVAAAVALYLFIGFYLSVATPVRRLVGVLRAVSAGELSSRVEVGTRDELDFVGRALNDTLATTQAATERLAHQAAHDTLTGLPNRAAVLARIAAELADARAGRPLPAVLFVDLDGFKVVNDSMGHEAGDVLLCGVAARLRQAVRDTDVVGRLAGDEFVVVAPRTPDRAGAVEVARRVLAGLEEPLAVPGGGGARRLVNIGASVGVAVAQHAHTDPDELLRDADMAMYRAKQLGRARWEVFDETLRQDMASELDTREDLRRAIGGDELVLHYQPIVDLGDGQVPSMEALVRWQHPTRGLLLPGDFIPVAEDSGLVVPLGAWVLEQACRQAAAWRRTGTTASTSVAVNLSAHQLADPRLAATVADVLRRTHLPPDALWLEITETAIMRDLREAARTLQELHRLGVHLAIDDFGTGWSSLAHLRQFPVDALKIDRSFVAGLGDSTQDDAIVGLVVGLAHNLGLEVVAEGVERAEQSRRLRALGCRYAQGFHLGRPGPYAAPVRASGLLLPR